MDVVFPDGSTCRVTVCPYRQRLYVIKNPGARKGFLIRRISDGALVAWARLKGHANDEMEAAEAAEELDLGAEAIWAMRRRLAEL